MDAQAELQAKEQALLRSPQWMTRSDARRVLGSWRRLQYVPAEHRQKPGVGPTARVFIRRAWVMGMR